MKGHISKSTAALFAVIALLAGALVVTISSPNRIPVFADTTRGAETGPITTFAPRREACHAGGGEHLIFQGREGAARRGRPGSFQRSIFPAVLRRPHAASRNSRVRSAPPAWVRAWWSAPDGYILTNNHVVDGATDVKVSFADKEEYPAKVIGTDKYTDVAVLKINKTGLTTLPFADSAHAEVGDVVLAIGEPFGLGQTVTMGIISAKGRAGLGIERFEDFIQTDAAINRGNSGGALIDTRGDLVGINTAILSGETGGNQGIGFAIPANLAHNIMDQIMSKGKVTRGYMGILPQELTPEMAKAFGVPNTHGVAIANVVGDSPAAKAGLKVGDVITAVNGTPVDDVNSFRLQVAGFAPGTTVHLKVDRNGQTLDLPVTLERVQPRSREQGRGRGQSPERRRKGRSERPVGPGLDA